MEWFKSKWNDPVWSNVIASAIVAILGFAVTVGWNWLGGGKSIQESLKIVLGYKVSLWLVLAVLIVVLIARGLIIRHKQNKERIPVPPFVNDFTRWQYQNQIWKWRWEWSPTNKFYYVTDLNIECPNCHEGLLDLEYMNYRCPKCNASYEFAWINGNPEGVKKQILEDARTRYNYCKEYIGEIKTGFVKK